MNSLPCEDKGTTFYEELQLLPGLDKRDRRGKRHDLGIVLLGFTLALLSKRDGNLSSIHRHMKNHYVETCRFVGILPFHVISRSQLPLVLSSVNVAVLEAHIFKFYGIRLSESEKQWFSGDGKELRGSIETGDKRGEAVVQLVAHDTGKVLNETFYNGKKASEKPAMRDLIVSSGACGQKISLDALHFSPETLQLIHQGGGSYLVGLKGNQKKLLAEMKRASQHLPCLYEDEKSEKKHGRIDTRSYESFDIGKEYIDKRWANCGLRTLIKVNRQRQNLKTGKESFETAFYMTDSESDSKTKAKELFEAVRKHWSVEVTNHIRDVTLNEDAFRTKKTIVPRLLQL